MGYSRVALWVEDIVGCRAGNCHHGRSKEKGTGREKDRERDKRGEIESVLGIFKVCVSTHHG